MSLISDPCPDCGQRMSGYGKLEYDHSKRRWRNIWYCGNERKWFEVVFPNARDYKLRFMRRYDIEKRTDSSDQVSMIKKEEEVKRE